MYITHMRDRIIVANWKMEPARRSAVVALALGTVEAANNLKRTAVVICPPFVHIAETARALERSAILLGAQDVFWESRGAHTGEVSPAMIAEYGAKYVIIGHSERRALGENDEAVNLKTRTALSAGLRPILCIGESVRDEQGEYASFVRAQLECALVEVSKQKAGQLIIAYEPIWAVGEKAVMAAHPAIVREMGIFIRRVLVDLFGRTTGEHIPILYGGSVDAKNAASYVNDARMNGLLVGRISLSMAKFKKVAQSVDTA